MFLTINVERFTCLKDNTPKTIVDTQLRVTKGLLSRMSAPTRKYDHIHTIFLTNFSFKPRVNTMTKTKSKHNKSNNNFINKVATSKHVLTTLRREMISHNHHRKEGLIITISIP